MLTNENLGDTLWFDWSASVDVDGDTLIYFFAMSDEMDVMIEQTTTAQLFGIEYSFFTEALDTSTTLVVNWTVSVTDDLDTLAANNGPFTLIIDDSTLAIDPMDVIPKVLALHQNHPNPFNPTTTLRYDLSEDTQVSIMIYDIMGREVRTLVNKQQSAGYKSVVWDATNNFGQPVSGGMYLYRISAGEFVQVKKMVLLK